MIRHPETGELRFYQMLAALFGQGSSVYSFERWSAFLEAVPRRLLGLLWSMYVDDGSLVDLAQAKGSGQALLHAFFDAIGSGLSEAKRIWMSQESTFLGVVHSFVFLQAEGEVRFWPKEAIAEELRHQIQRFRASRRCTPGEASKFRGVAGFAAEAQFGNLGKCALRPFKQRQYWDKAPWYFTPTMERSVSFLEFLLDARLERRVKVQMQELPALVVASDAQVEPEELPGGGVLIVDPDNGGRHGGFLEFTESALSMWGTSLAEIADGKQPIQLCEAAMIPLTLLQWPEAFRGRRVVWYVDNTSAMSAFVKGTSRALELEKLVNLFWMLAYHLECTVWFEWVDSESNWADGVSRQLAMDPFAQRHGFTLQEMEQPSVWWAAELPEVWRMASRVAQEQALG